MRKTTKQLTWSLLPAVLGASLAGAGAASAVPRQQQDTIDATCDGLNVSLLNYLAKPGVNEVEGVSAYDETVIDQAAYDETVIDQAAYDETIVDQAAYDETVIDQAAYDETVIDVPAYDETVTQPAYDETIVDQAAYDETVIDQAAYDETIVDQAATDAVTEVQYQWVRGNGQQQQFSWSALIPQPSGPWSATGQSQVAVITPAQPAVTHIVHHDAVTHVVHHDAVTHVVHHDAVTDVIHHDAITHDVHHDAITHDVHHDAITHDVHHDAITHDVHHDAITHDVHHDAVDAVTAQAADAAPNTVTVTVNGGVVSSVTFGESFGDAFSFPQNGQSSSWSVHVDAWNSEGDDASGDVGPCGTEPAAPTDGDVSPDGDSVTPVSDEDVSPGTAEAKLPDTGGASSAILLAGLATMSVGAGFVVAGKRRSA
jgi:LPXTG-motif cell wall-anchored protein